MAYMKAVKMSIEEAVQSELDKGFDTYDEMFEVVQDVAREYNVSSSAVMSLDRKSTRLNSSHSAKSRIPSSA